MFTNNLSSEVGVLDGRLKGLFGERMLGLRKRRPTKIEWGTGGAGEIANYRLEPIDNRDEMEFEGKKKNDGSGGSKESWVQLIRKA